jgi:hypothetical protein
MGGLLEGKGWKSTQEFVPTAGSDLKQLCTGPVPNQNEAEPNYFAWIEFRG